MDDSLPKIQIVKKNAAQALSDLKNNPPGGPVPSSVSAHKEIQKENLSFQEVPTYPEITSEMKEHGVEQMREEIELPEEVKKAGVESVDNLTVYEPPKENLIPQIPLTTAQMQKGLHAKVADSILWLVYWCVRQIKRAKRIKD